MCSFFFFPATVESSSFTDLQPLLLLVAPAAASTAFDATGQEGRVVAYRGRPISAWRGQLRLGVRLGNCLFLLCVTGLKDDATHFHARHLIVMPKDDGKN